MCFWDLKKIRYIGNREGIKRKFFREEGTLATFEEPENTFLKKIVVDGIRIT